MPRTVEYLIVQYTRDVMRREPKNIGVIVIEEAECFAKFIGEKESLGELDGRSARWCAAPQVYRQWLKYWRQELGRGGGGLGDRLANVNGDSYAVIPGGFVTDVGHDTLQLVCNKLYPMLVSIDYI